MEYILRAFRSSKILESLKIITLSNIFKIETLPEEVMVSRSRNNIKLEFLSIYRIFEIEIYKWNI